MKKRLTTAFHTRSEELALVAAAQAGDLAARNKLVETNLAFIRLKCRQFAQTFPRYKPAELLGIATMAYMNCIERFDLERGTKLNTPAGRAIYNALIRYATDDRSIVRVPSCSQRSAKTNPRCHVRQAAEIALAPTGQLSNRMPDKKPPARPTDDDELRAEYARANEIISTFPSRTQDVIRQRVYDELTLREISGPLGISRERVRQIFETAISAVRERMGK